MLRDSDVKVLSQLQRGPCTFTDLVDIVGNKRTTSLSLKRLISEDLVQKEAKRYELTGRGVEVARRLMEIQEIRNAPTIDTERIPHPAYTKLLRVYSNVLIQKLGRRLISIILFGSVARGTWDKDSDIDLVVIGEEFDDPMRALDELIDAKLELKETATYREILGRGWHPTIQHYPLAPDGISSRLMLDVVMDGIIIYDRKNFASQIEMLKDRLIEGKCYRVERPDGSWYWKLGGEIGEELGGVSRRTIEKMA